MKTNSSIEVAGPSHKHVPALDGVRGLAILLVLMFHMMGFNSDSRKSWINDFSAIRSMGWMGVDLFFVLSGFLITGILYDTLQDAHYFRTFYMRRFLRIFPLYYGFLFLLLILTPWLHAAWGGRQFVLLAYLQNTSFWFRVDDFHLTTLVDLNHFWSLAVEEQFYLIWPLIIFLVRDRKKLIRLSIFLSFCALLFRIGIYFHDKGSSIQGYPYEWTVCRMDTLMIGGCLALLLRGKLPSFGRQKLYRRLAFGYFWTAMLIMVAIAVPHPQIDSNHLPFSATVGYTMIAVAFAGLIYVVLDPASIWNRLFQMTWLRSLGRYSYGIYVLHILVGSLFGMWIHAEVGTSLRNYLVPWVHFRVIAGLLAFLVDVGVVYAAAWCSYNLYEVHFLRLKRYFGYGATKEKAVRQMVEAQ